MNPLGVPLKLCLAVGLLSFLAGPVAGFTLTRNLLTRDPETNTRCAVPQPVTQFPTTADQIYVWYSLDNLLTSDSFSAEWITPSGSVYARDSWERRSGSACFWWSIAPRANGIGTGIWTVRVIANGLTLFTLQVRICTGGGGLPGDKPRAGRLPVRCVVAG